MIAFIADDFTGAAEVAGICLRCGVTVSLLVNIPDVESIQAVRTDVLVLAEDTRSATRDGAVKVSRLLAENLKAAGVTRIVKKIDSVLRGWVLPEMRTIASVMGNESLVIQPANTDTDRSVRNGMYFVGETLLSESSFSRDPDFPATSSSVQKLLESRGGALETEEPVPYAIPDALNDEDLLHSVRLCNGNVLPGGSAAFCRVFLESQMRLGRLKSTPATEYGNPVFPLHDSLIICGSAHRNSRDFAERLKEEHFPVMEFPEALCQEEKPTQADYIHWVDSCVQKWEEERCLLIRTSNEQLSFPQAPEKLRYRMTETMNFLLQQIYPSQILIEGGATAWGIIQRLGWSSFTPVREWLPGVVQLKLNEAEKQCHITLKPGSYAWPEFRR